MSIKSFPFNSEPLGQNEFGYLVGDRDMDAADWAEYFSSFVGNGVFPYPEIGLTVRAYDGMTISVSRGRGWINGYYFHNKATSYLTVESPEPLPRIDRAVARWDIASREIYLHMVKGEASETPVPPELERNDNIYDLCLAEISVRKDADEITQLEIRDTRLDKSLCGLVIAAVQNIDFSTFALQFYAWFERVQNLLDESDTTKILSEIERLRTETVNTESLSIVNSIRTNRENDDVVIRTGAITAASGTVVFKTPFDTVPYVFIPSGGTTANVTTTGFSYSGSATNRFWVAIADNS